MKIFISTLLAIIALLISTEKAEAQNGFSNGLAITVSQPTVNLGWINPDGVKALSYPYQVIFTIRGVRKQQFSVEAKFYNKAGNVFITGNNWEYMDYNQKSWAHILSGNYFSRNNFIFNDTDGRAYVKLVPGILFAQPNAKMGLYRFDVELTVSYTNI